MGRHETVSASVVLASAEVNAAIHHLDPDRMIEAEMHRGGIWRMSIGIPREGG
jgi:hypothetical protein